MDGGRRHRRGRRRLRRIGQAGGRGRPRRRRDQRRPAQPGAPVPEWPDQPARRRVGSRSAALRPRRDRRGPSRARRRSGARAPAVVRRARPVGGDHAGDGARHRARNWSRAASTISSSLVARSSPPRRPGPTSTNRPGSTSTCAERCTRRVDIPVVLQGSIVEWGQAEWALGGFDDPARVRRRRADPRPDRRPRLRSQARRRRGGPDPTVHPVQPDLPGSRRPQPDRHLCRRTVERPRDRGSRLVPAGAPSTAPSR